ncbi:MAG: efflux RND transporter periplasmic adaptor subunit [Dissulfurispiraceae bacterium]
MGSMRQPKQAIPHKSEVEGKFPVSVLLPIVFALLVTVYVLSLTGCKSRMPSGPAEVRRQVVTNVSMVDVGTSIVDEYYETSGTARAKTISHISSRTMGNVTKLNVKEGDKVAAGQVLITIDDRDAVQKVIGAEKTVEAARQNRSLMETTYQRYKQLYDEKALSQQEIDQIESQRKLAEIEYDRAMAGLNEAQVYQGYTKIVAPVAGVVTEKKIDAGSMAAPGSTLLTVEDNSSCTIDAYADEHLLAKLKKGMPVEIVVDSAGQGVKGQIGEIAPAIDPASRTFLIKIELKGALLKTGQYARVRIPVGKKEVILLPIKAVVERGQLTGIYVVDDKGIISYRLIRTGIRYDGGVEVLSGVHLKERVITEGVDRAVDGGIVKQ